MIEKAVGLVNRFVHGEAPKEAPASLAEIALVGLDGQPLPADAIAGKAVLFVNVASRCGLTAQYEQLVALHKQYAAKGFEIVGAPCNQFMGQEPGTAGEIQEFCSTRYGVDFPLLEKQSVNGAERSPLYRWLVGSPAGGGKDIEWNFEKFLVGRDGAVLRRFSPKVKPDAAEIVSAIEGALRG